MADLPRPTLDLGWIDAQLAGTQFAGAIYHLAAVGSTNLVAAEAAQRGTRTGVWLADEQTAGRGRGGHSWHSAVGAGLYLSALVRPRLAGVDVLKLSLAAGLAARSAVLKTTSLPAERVDLRWPNDLMIWGLDGVERKFGGILTESAMDGGSGALGYAVVGIGMNLNHRDLPDELRGIASSLWIEGAGEVAREPLVVALLRGLEQELAALEREVGAELMPDEGGVENSLTQRFSQASTWVCGLAVEVAEAGGYTGVTAGLNGHGLLEIRLPDGSLRTVRHGGVRRVPRAGSGEV